MHKVLLCLRTRSIALAGIIGVMIGVAAMRDAPRSQNDGAQQLIQSHEAMRHWPAILNRLKAEFE